MNIKEILEFIKVTLENNVIAGVGAIKKHIFTVDLKSNKVEVTNQKDFPKVQKTQEVNPTPVDRITQKQTKEIVSSLEKQVKTLQKEIKGIKTYEKVQVTNLKDIQPPTEVKVKNPQKTVSIKNFYEVQKELGKIQKAIEKLKLDPTITVPNVVVPPISVPDFIVPEPKVTMDLSKLEELMSVLTNDPKKPLAVRLSDGKKFYEALSEMAETIVSGGGGGRHAFQNVNGDRTYGLVNALRQVMTVTEDRWGLNNSFKSGNTTYLGEEDVDGNWIVRKVVKNGGNISMSYATKKNNNTIETYTEAWTAKADLSYGLFSQAFLIT